MPNIKPEDMKFALQIIVPILTGIGGFLLRQYFVWRKNRVQAVSLIEVQNIPIVQPSLGKELKVVNGGGKEYKNVQFLRFELINTTLTKDLQDFEILFEFERTAVVISDEVEKQSKLHQVLKEGSENHNEIKYKIDLFNRKDKICFNFRVANTIYNKTIIHFRVPSVVLNHKKPKSISPSLRNQTSYDSLK